jgi:hypothetical protein
VAAGIRQAECVVTGFVKQVLALLHGNCGHDGLLNLS